MSDSTDLQISTAPSGFLHETPMAVGLGQTFGLDPKQVINVLRTQLIKVPSGKPAATPAELIVVMSTLNKYGLDPMMRQLYAWRDNRGDLACMLSLDGWVELARRQPGYKSVSYRYGADTPKSGKHKACWEWIEATVHDAERGDIVLPPLYIDEWRKDYGQWLEMPRHKMHVLAFRMAIREVYGISLDVRDPDDFQPSGYARAEATMVDSVDDMAARLEAAKADTSPHTSHAPDLEAEDVDWEAPSESQDEPDPEQAQPAGRPLFDPQAGCCFAVGCEKAWSSRCATCGERFCSDHMGENRMKCLVCGGGE